jgi:hypothetical protein
MTGKGNPGKPDTCRGKDAVPDGKAISERDSTWLINLIQV